MFGYKGSGDDNNASDDECHETVIYGRLSIIFARLRYQFNVHPPPLTGTCCPKGVCILLNGCGVKS
jgi:hypothetical protein